MEFGRDVSFHSSSLNCFWPCLAKFSWTTTREKKGNKIQFNIQLCVLFSFLSAQFHILNLPWITRNVGFTASSRCIFDSQFAGGLVLGWISWSGWWYITNLGNECVVLVHFTRENAKPFSSRLVVGLDVEQITNIFLSGVQN